ncbi:MAG: hypothetical protein LQ349_001919 [Xanthoria aureola]|nr:MAG: hypothetical protein LQ349_001919 [Xanthoria aureola]
MATAPDSKQPPSPIKPLPIASPSASILLISPSNQILLLRRVQASSSFASAHVFPGGHIDPDDGPLPPHGDVRVHDDSPAYRVGALRECFEESGILLARNRHNNKNIKNSNNAPSSSSSSSLLLQLTEQERDAGRNAIHQKQVRFQDWVRAHGGVLDTESLHPFTRWLTPAHIPKRFSTQMYLYFLPLAHPGIPQSLHIPTCDGGVEHTEAQFLPAAEWLSLARAGKIVLFPPQFFLLTLVADFLTAAADDDDDDGGGLTAAETLRAQRERLQAFVKTGDPPWGEKCISPWPLKKEGKRLVMGLDEPGPELEGTDRRGDAERVVFVQFKGKEGTSGMEVGWRKDVLDPGLEEGDEEKYLEARRKERERSRGGNGDLEQALRGRKEKL